MCRVGWEVGVEVGSSVGLWIGCFDWVYRILCVFVLVILTNVKLVVVN